MYQRFSFLAYSNILFVLFVACMGMAISGCKTTETIYRTEVQYVVVKPSNALLEECPPLQSKEIKTNGDLANAYTGLMFDYLVCSNRLKTIKDFFKEYENKDSNNSSSLITLDSVRESE